MVHPIAQAGQEALHQPRRDSLCPDGARRRRAEIAGEALAGLKGPWRTVLTMRYAEGSSLATIGALLGMSEHAVEGRLRRARAALKEQLQKTGSMENRS
ncbi:MAG TPA: sigma-70 family RNA polymerase sigma factor [Planctomycetes bacterium]|nr:sigma-70 family RNA polymerase sigma factor [Planctomycetota bacterium]HIK59901.1 sigma-70 family RNA polymerase sigma factor [Planctomycetota bacterium]